MRFGRVTELLRQRNYLELWRRILIGLGIKRLPGNGSVVDIGRFMQYSTPIRATSDEGVETTG
jgi:hypothetical protein